MVESPLGVAGIRGTQFGLSTDAGSTELAVLEGRVGFLDANQKAKSVETAQKVAGSEDGAGEVNALAESEKAELAKAVADSQESASEYDPDPLGEYRGRVRTQAKLHRKVRPQYGTDLVSTGEFCYGTWFRAMIRLLTR